jgi:tetratricopeptide (TPR) repeat protein
MMFEWFNAREAAEVGTALADQFAPHTAPPGSGNDKAAGQTQRKALEDLLRRADRDVRSLRLNVFKKAKFANSFKWRLIEKGVDRHIADEVTQSLVLHLSQPGADATAAEDEAAAPADRPRSGNARQLLAQANQTIARGAYADSVALYQELLRLNPRHVEGHNNLGAALYQLGRFGEAEEHFRKAAELNPNYADAHSNLGNLLRSMGRIAESEAWLRRALKLNPNHIEARNNLGFTLIFLGRLRDAKAHFKKVLKNAPRDADALFGTGRIAAIEGDFPEAEALYKRALAVNPRLPSAHAGLASLRKMTPADSGWLKGAEEVAAGGISPLDEADLRFAIGKYHDDLNEFGPAFEAYRRANELLKSAAQSYDRAERARFVDDMIRVYSADAISGLKAGASASMTPVFVVGMPRSGTSLAEQIIASHPAAAGAGELEFWSNAAGTHEREVRTGTLGEPARRKLAEDYLKILQTRGGDVSRVVDKAPVNSDYLGLIHSIFPNARILYMRRDPIDTCLSCYFHQFSAALDFTMDLSDLAHYYQQHQRLVAHWRAVLPPNAFLDVPYAELVADQEGWTRKILDFIGLEWDERCLEFHKTQRAVVTSSFWQVRQKIYKHSVARWRNYEKFITPLLGLRD